MTLIKELKSKIEKLIEVIPKDTNVFEQINKESLKSKLNRLQKIDEVLKKEKYNITFIGSVGAGKTTAISHLFNLIHNVEKKTITKRGKERLIEVVEPLLSTGSGRTTICEVVINSSDNISIEIDPYTKEELKEEIEYFCSTCYTKNNDNDNDETQNKSMSEEIERAIRSIVGLKKNIKVNDKNIDEAKEKAKELDEEQFIKFAIERADLENRCYTKKDTRLEFNGTNPQKWIKDNFSKINRGAISTFSIPKKIYLNVNKKIYGNSYQENFNTVIDTKGIDENPIRKDLLEQIEDENTILIFTSSYNDAPKGDIRALIEKALSIKSKMYEDRFVLLVMPRHNEPMQENDGDGSWENGTLLKKEIIKKVFKNKNLDFKEDNILFYDALKYYDLEGRIDRDYDEEDIEEEKEEILKSFSDIIEKRKEKLKDEVKNIEDSLSLQNENIELTKEDEALINKVKRDLENIRELDKRVPSYVYEEFTDSYIDYYATTYKAWNTKDAIHRRYGVFPERNYSTYFDAKVVAEGRNSDEMLKKFTIDLRKEVIKSIENLASEIKTLESITPSISKLFESDYDIFIESVGNRIEEFLQNENENREFWSDMIERRGQGSGYNDDVTRMFKNKLKSLRSGLSLDGLFQEFVEDEWEKLIDKILIFFKK